MPATTTTTAITLPLGAGTEGETVSWHLTDESGRPQHGVVVGPAGSGGTTALVRLSAAAQAAPVEVYTVAVDLYYADYLDPAWGELLPYEWWTTKDALRGGLSWAGGADADPAEPHMVLLVDGDRALRTDPAGWERLLERAERLRASVVVRVTSLDAAHLGSAKVREHLLGAGQYLALGHTYHSLTRAVLPGYTAPDGRQEPGRGVYGYDGDTVQVSVATPR
ncbi:hypothetical protein DFP74_6695 [Nocardiopsis sp. Huas11]|uniref:hypothetical protein n=1 Tax=Nocardiopsis sp. Huas11 TaxID=2183912 RepID=UPI000EAE0486|nr:hypothetical protein [Nocardiopsis sp. Huas11]RKR98974.1 hypothetical protein DFP74_6695 [Nocardiopsis sp. Huas11]